MVPVVVVETTEIPSAALHQKARYMPQYEKSDNFNHRWVCGKLVEAPCAWCTFWTLRERERLSHLLPSYRSWPHSNLCSDLVAILQAVVTLFVSWKLYREVRQDQGHVSVLVQLTIADSVTKKCKWDNIAELWDITSFGACALCMWEVRAARGAWLA